MIELHNSIRLYALIELNNIDYFVDFRCPYYTSCAISVGYHPRND